MPSADPYAPLARKLGVELNDDSLLARAFTHRSVSASKNNERLEFLGDALIGQVIALALFEKFPESREGELSRMRAALVNGRTMAELAQQLDLSNYLILGPGELKSGGHNRASILADAFEALIGAIYLQLGMDATRQLILNIYQNRLQQISPDRAGKDAKTELQELLQGRKLPVPEYTLVDAKGADHKRIFVVKCAIEAIDKAFIAESSSRKKAEQAAARQALQYLESV